MAKVSPSEPTLGGCALSTSSFPSALSSMMLNFGTSSFTGTSEATRWSTSFRSRLEAMVRARS